MDCSCIGNSPNINRDISAIGLNSAGIHQSNSIDNGSPIAIAIHHPVVGNVDSRQLNLAAVPTIVTVSANNRTRCVDCDITTTAGIGISSNRNAAIFRGQRGIGININVTIRRKDQGQIIAVSRTLNIVIDV